MSAFFKRGLLKDRQAGLVFYWRSIDKKDIIGYFVGLIVAIAVIAFLFYGVKVEVPKLSAPKNNRIHQVVIRQAEGSVLGSKSQLEHEKTTRWDPIDDPATQQRILNLSSSVILATESRQLSLFKPEIITEKSPIDVLPSRGVVLPERDYKKPTTEKVAPKCIYTIELIKDSYGERVNGVPLLEADALLLGENQQFIISVSPEGNIVLCTPVSEENLPLAEKFLRNVKFQPKAGQSDEVFKVNIRVKEVTQ